MKYALIISAVLLALSVVPAHAAFIVFGTHADYQVEPGRSIEDVRLAVDLQVVGQHALLTFTNASVNGEEAVIKEIVIDGVESDSGAMLLWSPEVLTHSSEVTFNVSSHPNGLPGYGAETADANIELLAKSSPVKYGLSAGESLQVRFDTSLNEGGSIYDYFGAFGDGEDTPACSIGFHAISSSALNGQSLTGVAVPEPATLGLLALGGLTMLVRRRVR